VTILDDIAAVGSEFSRRVEALVDQARGWAASETGQEILFGLDFVVISGRAGDFYRRHGWYVPLHPALLGYVLDHDVQHQPFDPRRATDLVGVGSEHWPWIRDGLLKSPAIESRRPVVEDALAAMEAGRWHGAICTILPVLEGIISDRSGVLEHMRVGKRFEVMLDTADAELISFSAASALDVLDGELFKSWAFPGVAISEDALNRHLILHGRTVAFGTPVNATRILMIAVALVELLDGPLLFRTDVATTDSGSVFDEHGPFAEFRRVARRSRRT
jgi:hypothetical protein